MSVLEYEKRFHDLLLFAPHYVPTKEYMIEKLRDGFRQELKQGLIAVQFKLVRELIEAAQALEACIGEGQQGHHRVGKKREGKKWSVWGIQEKGNSSSIIPPPIKMKSDE